MNSNNNSIKKRKQSTANTSGQDMKTSPYSKAALQKQVNPNPSTPPTSTQTLSYKTKKQPLEKKLNNKSPCNDTNPIDSQLKDIAVDSHLQAILEASLSSMIKLRVQMEKLTDAQKKEEANYIQTIKQLSSKNNTERERKKDTEARLLQRLEDLEKRLIVERKERMKAQKLFANFRDEGSSIIYRLRDSLTSITGKYDIASRRLTELEERLEEEILKNDELGQMYDEAMEALNKTSIGGNLAIEEPSIQNDKNYTENIIPKYSLEKARRELKNKEELANNNNDLDKKSNWDLDEITKLKEKVKKEKELRMRTEQKIEERFLQFQSLVEEEEAIIDSLKEKLKKIEIENQHLKMQSQSGDTVKEDLNTGEITDIHEDYTNMYTELKNLLDPEDNKNLRTSRDQKINPYDRIKAQNRLINLLLEKLKKEEQERGKIEEQSVRIASEGERTILFLEKKIKELEEIVIQQKEETSLENKRLKSLIAGDILKQFFGIENEEKMSILHQGLQKLTNECNQNSSNEVLPDNQAISDKDIKPEEFAESCQKTEVTANENRELETTIKISIHSQDDEIYLNINESIPAIEKDVSEERNKAGNSEESKESVHIRET